MVDNLCNNLQQVSASFTDVLHFFCQVCFSKKRLAEIFFKVQKGFTLFTAGGANRRLSVLFTGGFFFVAVVAVLFE